MAEGVSGFRLPEFETSSEICDAAHDIFSSCFVAALLNDAQTMDDLTCLKHHQIDMSMPAGCESM